MPRSLNSVRPNLVKYWFAGEQKKISGIAMLTILVLPFDRFKLFKSF